MQRHAYCGAARYLVLNVSSEDRQKEKGVCGVVVKAT